MERQELYILIEVLPLTPYMGFHFMENEEAAGGWGDRGQKSCGILSNAVKIITCIPQVIILTFFLIIAGNFPLGISLQVVAKMPHKRVTSNSCSRD